MEVIDLGGFTVVRMWLVLRVIVKYAQQSARKAASVPKHETSAIQSTDVRLIRVGALRCWRRMTRLRVIIRSAASA